MIPVGDSFISDQSYFARSNACLVMDEAEDIYTILLQFDLNTLQMKTRLLKMTNGWSEN